MALLIFSHILDNCTHGVLFKETKPHLCKNKHLRPTGAELCLCRSEAKAWRTSPALMHGPLETTWLDQGCGSAEHTHSDGNFKEK